MRRSDRAARAEKTNTIGACTMTDASGGPVPLNGYHVHVALWLGTPIRVRLETLRRSYRAEPLPSA